jgi:3-oxoacyl-[acyl-carrier-protein] synthase III
MEALGDDAARAQTGSLRLGIVVCVLAGSVAYSRRFYEETSRDPATASPVIFPETVFNAPASHLAAYLGSTGASCTVVGDDGAFLQGLAMASDWLLRDEADGCIVVGAEEMDWIVSDAVRLFHRDVIQGDGAGAIYIRRNDAPGAIAALAGITDAFPFTRTQSRIDAARRMRAQFPAGGAHDVLCLGTQGLTRADAA